MLLHYLTARRAYQNNPKLRSIDIGKAIGRARRTVDLYIADLKAAAQMELDLKLFSMKILGIPQERISERLDIPLKTIYNHISVKFINIGEKVPQKEG